MGFVDVETMRLLIALAGGGGLGASWTRHPALPHGDGVELGPLSAGDTTGVEQRALGDGAGALSAMLLNIMGAETDRPTERSSVVVVMGFSTKTIAAASAMTASAASAPVNVGRVFLALLP